MIAARTAAMLTHASAPSSRGKQSGMMMMSVIAEMMMRLSARMLSAPAPRYSVKASPFAQELCAVLTGTARLHHVYSLEGNSLPAEM